jgi:hypothetical protein
MVGECVTVSGVEEAHFRFGMVLETCDEAVGLCVLVRGK